MRTMLSNFKPEWYKRIKDVGMTCLGRKIDINTWKCEEVCEKTDDYLTRHTYAITILSFQLTKQIDFGILREFNPNFVCPQMYYYLENYSALFEFIKGNATEFGELYVNSFVNIGKDELFRTQY